MSRRRLLWGAGGGGGQVQRPLKYLSLVGWLPAQSLPSMFVLDTSVNQYKLQEVCTASSHPPQSRQLGQAPRGLDRLGRLAVALSGPPLGRPGCRPDAARETTLRPFRASLSPFRPLRVFRCLFRVSCPFQVSPYVLSKSLFSLFPSHHFLPFRAFPVDLSESLLRPPESLFPRSESPLRPFRVISVALSESPVTCLPSLPSPAGRRTRYRGLPAGRMSKSPHQRLGRLTRPAALGWVGGGRSTRPTTRPSPPSSRSRPPSPSRCSLSGRACAGLGRSASGGPDGTTGRRAISGPGPLRIGGAYPCVSDCLSLYPLFSPSPHPPLQPFPPALPPAPPQQQPRGAVGHRAWRPEYRRGVTGQMAGQIKDLSGQPWI